MKTVKTHFRAFVFVFGLLFLTTFLWVQRLNQAYLNTEIVLTSVFGAWVLIILMITFLLSTRQRLIVKWFGGLDILYIWHRFTAMASLGLIFLHQTVATDEGLIILSRYRQLGLDVEDLGELSRNLFIFLIVMALFAKWMKYEHFKYLHKLMILPYLFGLYHGFASSWVDLLALDTLSIFMISTSLIGLGSSLYMLIFYQHVAFKYTGSVTKVTHLTNTMIDIKVKVSKPYKFKPGQHCFIRFENKQLSKHPHPFSISGTDDDYIYFTIKNLGDFTKVLVDQLTPNTIVHLSKPYGHMTFKTTQTEQVWVAGGVGVTPFLSYIRSDSLSNQPITLFYAVRNLDEAIHVDTFQTYASNHPNFKFVLFDSSKEGFLSSKHLPLNDHVHVSMCGPKPMVDSIKKGIKKSYPNIPMTIEAFSFTGNLVSDVITFIKKSIRSINLKRKTQ